MGRASWLHILSSICVVFLSTARERLSAQSSTCVGSRKSSFELVRTSELRLAAFRDSQVCGQTLLCHPERSRGTLRLPFRLRSPPSASTSREESLPTASLR